MDSSCNTADPYGAFPYICFSSSLKYQDNSASESVTQSYLTLRSDGKDNSI